MRHMEELHASRWVLATLWLALRPIFYGHLCVAKKPYAFTEFSKVRRRPKYSPSPREGRSSCALVMGSWLISIQYRKNTVSFSAFHAFPLASFGLLILLSVSTLWSASSSSSASLSWPALESTWPPWISGGYGDVVINRR